MSGEWLTVANGGVVRTAARVVQGSVARNGLCETPSSIGAANNDQGLTTCKIGGQNWRLASGCLALVESRSGPEQNGEVVDG
ncbi:hypothetical protein NL676_028224 [Syzygium grande]|nr:hypothetical protein NL676_028224 [Syzygium grande]